MSPTEIPLTRARLKTPRSAAIAGIVFSVLLTTILWLFRSSVPSDPLDPGEWLATDTRRAAFALNLIPFAGVSFLWFIGVLRDRLGPLEDRFFATVLLGSAILFLAGLFAAAAAMGAVILTASGLDPGEVAHSGTFKYARAAAYIIANVYTAKMAAVFMVSTSTIIIYTRIAPRWIALVGYALALTLLIVSYAMSWSAIVLPLWVFLISIHILLDNLRGETSSKS